MRTALAALFLLFVSVIPAAADLEQAKSDYESGRYEAAYRAIEPLAKGGIAEAQYFLGRMYRKGKFVAQNREQTEAWYQKAADQGHCKATVELSDFMFAQASALYEFKQYDKSREYNLALELIHRGPQYCPQVWLRYYWHKYDYLHWRPLGHENESIETLSKDPEYTGKSEAELRRHYKEAHFKQRTSIGALLIISAELNDELAIANKDQYLAGLSKDDMAEVREIRRLWIAPLAKFERERKGQTAPDSKN